MKVQINALVASLNVGEKPDKQGNVRTYVDVYDRDARTMVKLSITDKKAFPVADGEIGTLSGDLRQGTFEGRSFLVLTNPHFAKFKP